MLLPFDPLLRWRLGGRRFTVRLSTLLVLAVVASGVGSRRNDLVAGVAPVAAWLVATAWHAALGVLAAGRLRVPVERCDLALFGATVEPRANPTSPKLQATLGAAGLAGLVALVAPVTVVYRVVVPGGAWGAALDPALVALGCLTVAQAMPGWPLDGGRLFAAFAASVTDDAATGLCAAVVYARLIALATAVGGLLLLPAPGEAPFWGLWLTAGAVQVGAAADAARRRATWERLGRSLALGDLATPMAIPIRTGATITAILDRVLAAGSEAPLLVVDAENRAVGVLRLANLRAAPRTTWDSATVGAVATPLRGMPRLNATLPVTDALASLDALDAEIGLIERDGTIVAAVSRRQLLEQPVRRSGI